MGKYNNNKKALIIPYYCDYSNLQLILVFKPSRRIFLYLRFLNFALGAYSTAMNLLYF